MKNVKLVAFALASGAFLAGCADDPVAPALSPDVASRQVATSIGDMDLDALLAQVPSKHIVVFQGRSPRGFEAEVAALGGTVTLNHAIGIAVVRGLDDASAARLKSAIGAAWVEPVAALRLIEPAGLLEPTATSVEMSSMMTEPASAADPTAAIRYADQWNMRQIHADGAWAAGRLGSGDVTVAILDTGIDYLLPDLRGRVDLERSASFNEMDDILTAMYYPGRHPSTDLHYHGTNVATQVASNGIVHAGVTSRTMLMSVKVCGILTGCTGVIEGLLYAIDNGADVINMSLGGWFVKGAWPGQVSAFNAIFNYAKQRGVTIVVSAGNDSNDLDTQQNIGIKDEAGNIVDRVHLPSLFAAYCDAAHVLCVSATRAADAPASYTNYGHSSIDVAAPGGDAGEWVYSLCPQTSLLYNCRSGYYVFGVAGTSQAAPHVAGLAALAVEDVGRNPARVRAYVRNSADPIGASGNTAFYGAGRINVARAVGAN